MIISHRKRFMFVHIPRTGGTSIRKCLQPYASVPVWQHPSKLGKQSNPKLEKHVKAETLFSIVKSDGYFTFGFVRNPWDWILSIYLRIKHDRQDPRHERIKSATFDEFLQIFEDYDSPIYPARNGQYNYLCDSSQNQLVDFIGRFERLNEDFDVICKRIDVKARLTRNNGIQHSHYRNYYCDRSRRLVHDMFYCDIERFGYSF